MSAQPPKQYENSAGVLLRQLPSVDQVLTTPSGKELSNRYGHSLTVTGIRSVLEEKRANISFGQDEPVDLGSILEEVGGLLANIVRPSPLELLNATGVIIHTNLGRAPLSEKALKRTVRTSSGYSDLEYDLVSGQRGTRTVHAAQLINQITGSEAALVVNNNAAAVLLMLTALCRNGEVVISRGQLVEIGGGFRIPDIMAQSGAKLVEVGTTNRTHISDYQRAIGDNTVAILAAHHSNFKIIGFTSEPGLAELSQLAHEHQLLMLYDQGSGALIDTAPYGLEHEPTVGEAIDNGVDLVSFSGDKLLGGPQAGILIGSSKLVGKLKRHPLARAVRADKLCLAALTETLIAHLTGRAVLELPVWQMISLDLESIYKSAAEIAEAIGNSNLQVQVVEGESTVGGGSLPGTTLPTWLVALTVNDAGTFSTRLRENDPPIITRIADGKVIFDPRTLLPGQSDQVVEAILKISDLN